MKYLNPLIYIFMICGMIAVMICILSYPLGFIAYRVSMLEWIEKVMNSNNF